MQRNGCRHEERALCVLLFNIEAKQQTVKDCSMKQTEGAVQLSTQYYNGAMITEKRITQ